MEIGLKMGNRDDKPLEKPLCLVERLLALQGATWQKQGEPHRAASLGQGTGCSLVRVRRVGGLLGREGFGPSLSGCIVGLGSRMSVAERVGPTIAYELRFLGLRSWAAIGLSRCSLGCGFPVRVRLRSDGSFFFTRLSAFLRWIFLSPLCGGFRRLFPSFFFFFLSGCFSFFLP